jgi:hypothetical protein
LAGHVVRMEERRGAYRVLDGKPEGKRPLGWQGVDGRIILKLFSRNKLGGRGLGSLVGSCEHGNELFFICV